MTVGAPDPPDPHALLPEKVLYEGVPPHLERAWKEWLRLVLVDEDFGERVALQLRRTPAGRWGYCRSLIDASERDDLVLVTNAVLQLINWSRPEGHEENAAAANMNVYAERLELILDGGGSAYTVDISRRQLVRRVDLATRRAVAVNDAASGIGVSAVRAGLVPIHIGQRRSSTGPSSRGPSDVPWEQVGLEPRWLGQETSDCAAAIEPSFAFGDEELARFRAGAAQRDEIALAVARIGIANERVSPSIGPSLAVVRKMMGFDSSVQLNAMKTSVHGRRLPSGVRPKVADRLSRADRDLALRLLNRPTDAPWWELRLSPSTFTLGTGTGPSTKVNSSIGTLDPILVDSLGEPVAAAWTPRSGGERWYIIPDGTDWRGILDWLVQQALPERVPEALRRARSPFLVDAQFQTVEEAAARQALEDLEDSYLEEKQHLESTLERATLVADPIRSGLLYGTGEELVAAVLAVLTAAGLSAVDLDSELGDTKSADLLVTDEQQRRVLIEVKSASGAARESLATDLRRHLDTWNQLRPDAPVRGGALIVNYQQRLAPAKRDAGAYTRREFVDALTTPVIGSLELFEWWRTADWTSLRTALYACISPPTSRS